MPTERARELLQQLRSELNRPDAEIDAQTLEQIQALDAEIHALIERERPDVDPASIVDEARSIEADFTARHPVAGGVLRQLIDTLSRMGV